MNTRELEGMSREELVTPVDWRVAAKNEGTREEKERLLRKMPGVAAVFFTGGEVNDKVGQLAELQARDLCKEQNGLDISEELSPEQVSQVRQFVTILSGGNKFMTNFSEALQMSYPYVILHRQDINAGRFGEGSQRGKQELEVTQDIPSGHIHGRNVTLVDEVVDEGLTLELIHKLMVERGAESVGALALCDKQLISGDVKDSFSHFVTGLTLPSPWAGGMGMDSRNEQFRNWPFVFLTKVQASKYRKGTEEVLEYLTENGAPACEPKDIKYI